MQKVDLSSYRNPEYDPGASLIKRVVWISISWFFFQSYLFPVSSAKRFMLRLFGAKVGRKVVIKPAVLIKHPWFLTVGDNTWIGERVWIDNLVSVEIGDNVCISQGAMLLTGNHDYKSPQFDLITKPIKIQSGAWLGAKSVVCPGVDCGFQSVLSVGSVATRSLDANQVYSGNPASRVRERVIT